MTESQGSVTQCLRDLQEGDQAAASPLWDRYFRDLAKVAKYNLRGFRSGAFDAEDIAVSAFRSFCRKAQNRQFENLEDRNSLWQILVVIARRKAISTIRRETAQKRGGGRPATGFLEELIAREPTPEFTAELVDQAQYYLKLIERDGDKTLKLVAERALQGDSSAEIAADLSVSQRAIQRKLKRIRLIWSNEADQSS